VKNDHFETVDTSEWTWFGELSSARPGFAVHGTLVGLLLLLIGTIAWSWFCRMDIVVESVGRLRGGQSPRASLSESTGEPVAATVAGKILDVSCPEGDAVKRGDVLMRLDTAVLDEEIAGLERLEEGGRRALGLLEQQRSLVAKESEAALGRIDAEIVEEQQRIEVGEARQDARVRLAKLKLERVTRKEEQLRSLAEDGILSDAEYEEAEANVAESQAEYDFARVALEHGRLDVLRSDRELEKRQTRRRLEELETRISVKRGEVESLGKQLSGLIVQRERMVVRSPCDGVVIRSAAVRGKYVEPGDVLVWVCRGDGLRFDGLVATGNAGKLRVGMSAKVRIDAFESQDYGWAPGVVEYIAPDSRADSNGVLSYLVSIRLEETSIGPASNRRPLRIGMGGVADVVTDRDRILAWLARKVLPDDGGPG